MTAREPRRCPPFRGGWNTSESVAGFRRNHRLKWIGIACWDPSDYARIGQQGTLTRVWAERGSRPAAPRDQRYSWAYLFGAICPARGTGTALVLPFASADMMNLHLAEISRNVKPGAHAVLTIDGAGWHQTSDKLRVPDNITLLHLPPYSPELNPVENVWAYLRGNKLSNRVFDTYEAIVEACCDAWLWLTQQPDRIISIGTCDWACVSQ